MGTAASSTVDSSRREPAKASVSTVIPYREADVVRRRIDGARTGHALVQTPERHGRPEDGGRPALPVVDRESSVSSDTRFDEALLLGRGVAFRTRLHTVFRLRLTSTSRYFELWSEMIVTPAGPGRSRIHSMPSAMSRGKRPGRTTPTEASVARYVRVDKGPRKRIDRLYTAGDEYRQARYRGRFQRSGGNSSARRSPDWAVGRVECGRRGAMTALVRPRSPRYTSKESACRRSPRRPAPHWRPTGRTVGKSVRGGKLFDERYCLTALASGRFSPTATADPVSLER